MYISTYIYIYIYILYIYICVCVSVCVCNCDYAQVSTKLKVCNHQAPKYPKRKIYIISEIYIKNISNTHI